jgi:hypothetical protein
MRGLSPFPRCVAKTRTQTARLGECLTGEAAYATILTTGPTYLRLGESRCRELSQLVHW